MNELASLSRIARGVHLVVEKLIVSRRPAVQIKMDRFRFHALELMKVAYEIRNDMSTSEKVQEQQSHTASSSSSSTHDDSYASNTTINAVSIVPTETVAPHVMETKSDAVIIPVPITKPNQSSITKPITKEEDLIGFSSIETPVKGTNHTSRPIKTNAPMRERAVPATQLERMWGFGSLAARMAMGAMTDNATRALTGDQSQQGGISDANAERLAEALCRMRGAALKLGQMLSLQDDAVLPGPLARALDRVKQSADYMPKSQLEKQLIDQLGPHWRAQLSEFDYIPIAAASIGQVHRAKLLDGTEVAMKIQYPGVADSIDSDLNNLKRIVTLTNALPPGLFIDQIISVARTELSWECDYLMEAESQTRYREHIMNDPLLNKHTFVPQVYPQLSSARVLTSSFVTGVAIDKAIEQPEAVRNAIARIMLVLTIRELFEWRFIQSDPNFGNFLYDETTRKINLIDFGAAREYSKSFVDGYMKLVWAAANNDRTALLQVSKEVGFLTGDETPEMMEAHLHTGLVFGEPFMKSEPYDFGSSNLSRRIGKHGDIFLKYRLKPPPTEAYSLHRKLAGDRVCLVAYLPPSLPCHPFSPPLSPHRNPLSLLLTLFIAS